MGKKTYPSGLLPADTAPATPDRKPKGPDNLADRLEMMLGSLRTTPLTQLQAALYLHQFDDGRELALCLGVVDAFDGIARVRAAEGAGATDVD